MSLPPPIRPTLAQRLADLLASLSHFPWKSTAITLRERFR
jgi:membrane protein